MTMLPPAEKIAQKLHIHHRADVWLRAWSGIGVRGKELAQSKNPERRSRCERDLLAFLTEYLPARFYSPSPAHLAIVADFEAAILSQSKVHSMQAEAAPRSMGKTTIEEGAALWAAFYHHCNLIVFICAIGPKGEERVESLENEIKTNARLREDFPELVEPVLAFGGDPRRARPGYPWSCNEFRLMNGVYVEGRGIDSAVRGLNKNGLRPDLVILDDIESIDSVGSETETEIIEKRIRQEVLGLGDINRSCAYFFICTVIARGCIADRFTDPKKEPEWRGRRYAALVEPPARAGDLWETFVDLCKGVAA